MPRTRVASWRVPAHACAAARWGARRRVAARLTLLHVSKTLRARRLAAADQLPLLKLVMARSALHAAFGRAKATLIWAFQGNFRRRVIRCAVRACDDRVGCWASPKLKAMLPGYASDPSKSTTEPSDSQRSNGTAVGLDLNCERVSRALVLSFEWQAVFSPSTAKLVTWGARRSTCDPL